MSHFGEQEGVKNYGLFSRDKDRPFFLIHISSLSLPLLFFMSSVCSSNIPLCQLLHLISKCQMQSIIQIIIKAGALRDFIFAMAIVNPRNVANLLIEEYRRVKPTRISAADVEMKNKIVEILREPFNEVSVEYVVEDDDEGTWLPWLLL